MEKSMYRLDKGQIGVVDDQVAAIIKAKTGPERLSMAWDAWAFFELRITAHLKSLHPEWTVEQIQKDIFRRVAYGSK